MAPRHFETWSDEALQQQALSVAAEREAVLTEVLFRTLDALNAEMRAAAFQFGAWLRDLTR